MREAVADIETNGFLDVLTTVHSLCYGNEDGIDSCTNDSKEFIGVEVGLRALMKFDKVVFHNGIKFDLPAIQKVYPWFELREDQLVDTLVLSRLIWPDLADRDFKLIKKGKLPPRLRGSHSLEAWGYRLGLHKGDYAKEMEESGLDPWAEWNPEMQSYCEQDVVVTRALWKLIKSKNYSPRAIELEHRFCHVVAKQERFGFKFDKDNAVQLYTELMGRRSELDAQLQEFFPPWYVKVCDQTPKRNNRKLGYVEGCTFTKIKLEEFNPGSRQQIAARLKSNYGWEPKDFTDTGEAKVDETVLEGLSYPPAKLLAERFTVEKRIGQIAEGQAGWLKLEKNGRIHGSVNTNGAVTGRCTHSSPNMAQVPSTGAPYGHECRSCFTVDEGYVLIGCDASGLELRCLAHYMARWDEGRYGEIILKGSKEDGTDIHTMNQKAAGLPTRDNAKTFIYGFLYGAGDAKIGSIIGKGPKAGKKLKQEFLRKTPALKKLKEAIEATVKKRGYLIGIDGRKLHIRSQHAALNTLLQSAGGLLVKQATVNLYDNLSAAGYEWGKDWAMVAHVHDEFQLQVCEEIAEEVAAIAVQSFRQAGEQFNWRILIDGEAQIGKSWAETH
ncbi:hypothetical protein GCM10007160_18150 [Litchfieldella qijiaojingensis]|uniref:DNA polymerase I n=1 Tax=Litchfieldella qijiaojingensis TaxID=980347 RepID=A0ABQ2YPG3_9GAMM|nr:DNA polymerase [Halomonas qijiaojingensis]GGX91047.1 hypothetical protein GCM10007160_18150 [Halomonas qijiaojingensis]